MKDKEVIEINIITYEMFLPLKRTERRRRKPTSLRRTEEADKTMTSWLVSRRTVI